MRKLLLILALVGTMGAINAQDMPMNNSKVGVEFDVNAGLFSAGLAVSDGYDTAAAGEAVFSAGVGVGVDFASNSPFKAQIGMKAYYVLDRFIPLAGISIGADAFHFNAMVNHNGWFFFGLGSDIKLNDDVFLNPQIQYTGDSASNGSTTAAIAILMPSLGVKFKF